MAATLYPSWFIYTLAVIGALVITSTTIQRRPGIATAGKTVADRRADWLDRKMAQSLVTLARL